MFEETVLLGDFTLTSGKKTNVFYDFHRLSPKETLNVCEKLLDVVPKDYDFVVAPASGGILPGFIVAGSDNKPLVVIDHDNTINGVFPKEGKRFLVVDDVISSYTTYKRMRNTLPGFQCVGIVAYIFRGEEPEPDIPTFFLERKEVEK